MAGAYRYYLVATDYSAAMPVGTDPGKGSMADPGAGPFAKGYKVLQGNWNPNGLGIVEFETPEKAEAWLKTAEGKEWAGKYNGVILALMNA